LKYTRNGHIRVKLERTEAEVENTETQDTGEPTAAPVATVKLTISDTGQGMSAQFMRTKLYTPFAQENSIAPGTGLGLSLVKSMVAMLNGEISINSTLGQGTTVTVQFPMSHSSSNSSTATSASTSGSTPPSAGSIERVKDDSLAIVQQHTRGRRAMLYPDDEAETSDVALGLLRKAISRYLTGWYGFELVKPWSKAATNLDVIIVDEEDLPGLIDALPQALDSPDGPIVVVMCAASSRRSQNKVPKAINIEAVSCPFGPYKLAKCIRLCLERMERKTVAEIDSDTQGAPPPEQSAEESGVEDVISAVEQITISNPGNPDINILKSGEVIAHEDSVHAGLVSSSSSGGSQEKTEYPFPLEDGTVSPSNLDTPANERPSLATRRTISPTLNEITRRHQPVEATATSSKGVMTSSPSEELQSEWRTPRLLLVDDNKVNLRLLQTFMKKRKYTDIFSAEDGQQAVSVFQDLLSATPPRPPDIIFLDISMPIMNGFEAARKIREIELDFRDHATNPLETPPTSLIIALTGLASGRDQSEAFTSGFDLYLVKPISFKEVGRLLDNWEKNGWAATVGVPHGAVIAGGADGVIEDAENTEAS
jgi:CheY-like chemotaxis protein